MQGWPSLNPFVLISSLGIFLFLTTGEKRISTGRKLLLQSSYWLHLQQNHPASYYRQSLYLPLIDPNRRKERKVAVSAARVWGGGGCGGGAISNENQKHCFPYLFLFKILPIPAWAVENFLKQIFNTAIPNNSLISCNHFINSWQPGSLTQST